MAIGSRSSIRLQELGPRLTLELMKVERGLCEGEVLYHSYVTKTTEEVSWVRATADCRTWLRQNRPTLRSKNMLLSLSSN